MSVIAHMELRTCCFRYRSVILACTEGSSVVGGSTRFLWRRGRSLPQVPPLTSESWQISPVHRPVVPVVPLSPPSFCSPALCGFCLISRGFRLNTLRSQDSISLDVCVFSAFRLAVRYVPEAEISTMLPRLPRLDNIGRR